MRVIVTHIAEKIFEVKNEAGASFRLAGTADVSAGLDRPSGDRGGEENSGGSAPDLYLRPMEALLGTMASCAGIDVVKILTQQKEPFTGLTIAVEGKRADAVPAVFTDIHLRYEIRGPVAENKGRRAVALSQEKYCSVSKMIEPTVKISYEVVLVP